jgi:hypothetical protein
MESGRSLAPLAAGLGISVIEERHAPRIIETVGRVVFQDEIVIQWAGIVLVEFGYEGDSPRCSAPPRAGLTVCS